MLALSDAAALVLLASPTLYNVFNISDTQLVNSLLYSSSYLGSLLFGWGKVE